MRLHDAAAVMAATYTTMVSYDILKLFKTSRNSIVSSFNKLKSNPAMLYGIPMLLLIVGGSFGLREFAQIRYDAQAKKTKITPEVEALMKSRTKSTTLEEEYEKIQKVDLDGWKNIRGPRPWEDSKESQRVQREHLSEKKLE
ncbi:hypothetical protein DNTS_008517 [Danionella cerebrum]|uniref:Cytochrome c oxidase assembly protein COX16 homolog, mitochondrial n=1 Tax=Danionella cerebrum TaxID=2873325 RepID=A0A553QMZ6_9TELE|nr:hypothetical protein DNTS_008517 [Danionella translucida]